jgi:hypothetical protein
LVSAIVKRVKDYRQGEVPVIDSVAVLAWLDQFDPNDRPTILREMNRILATYISRTTAKGVLADYAVKPELVGPDPAAFWRAARCLQIQQSGTSQRDMLGLLDEVLREKFGISPRLDERVRDHAYIYVDDVSCSGSRIKHDLLTWMLRDNIRDAIVHVICVATYRLGEYNVMKGLNAELRERNTHVKFWPGYCFENRLSCARHAEVFWPTHLPEDPYVKQWHETLPPGRPLKWREPGGAASRQLFSSEEARGLIEQAFLKKGAYIRSLPQNAKAEMRPLGFSKLVTPGFGTTIVTYRNCPNNAPLVLWWGDPNGAEPLSRWRPLFPRRFPVQNPREIFGF